MAVTPDQLQTAFICALQQSAYNMCRGKNFRLCLRCYTRIHRPLSSGGWLSGCQAPINSTEGICLNFPVESVCHLLDRLACVL